MYDNDVIAAIVSRLESELAVWPWPTQSFTVGAQQKQQPTQQGREDEPTVFVEKLFDRVVGTSGVAYVASSAGTGNNFCDEVETQVYTTTFQISAACTQDPRDTYRPTAADLADIARTVLQRRSAIRYFQPLGINLMRVADIRNVYFTNEQDRQEAMPAFDIVVSFTRSTPAEVIGRIEYVIPTIEGV